MGGLLDRATHVADQTFEPKPNPDATTIVLGEVSPPDPDGTTGTGPFVDGMFGLTGGATQGIAFGLSALFALIGMIITFRMGSIRAGSVVFLFATLAWDWHRISPSGDSTLASSPSSSLRSCSTPSPSP